MRMVGFLKRFVLFSERPIETEILGNTKRDPASACNRLLRLRFVRDDRKTRRAGFTLIELLVAMTIMALMMPFLYAYTQTGVKAWTHSGAHALHIERVQSIQSFLCRQIEYIYPKYANSDGRVDFEGRRDFLLFFSPTSADDAGSLKQTKLTIVQDGAGMKLVVTQTTASAPKEETKTLIDGLRSASFSYFGKGIGQAVLSWQETWTNNKELPQLIRMRAQFVDDTRRWPDFVIAPRTDVDVGCIYDPQTKFCQGR